MPGLRWPAVADFVTYYALAEFRIRRHDFDIVDSLVQRIRRERHHHSKHSAGKTRFP